MWPAFLLDIFCGIFLIHSYQACLVTVDSMHFSNLVEEIQENEIGYFTNLRSLRFLDFDVKVKIILFYCEEQ